MTTLASLPVPTTTRLRPRRPLALVGLLGGALAAGSTLLVCLALGLVGWFASDAGAHGQPRDGLAVGAHLWLMAHRSGVRVDGVAVSAVPLLLTWVCAWTTWRTGHRVGALVSGHGPDADRIADGERDWTVASAGVTFAVGYVVVAAATLSLAGTAATAPSGARVVLWSLLACLVAGAPAIAVGSGRASIWAAFVPAALRAAASHAWDVARAFWLVSLVALVVALALDVGTALNVLSQLRTDPTGAGLVVVGCLLVLPNAALFSGAYLLGPGFTVGAGTLVSPAAVVLGPLPLVPLLAALPGTGPVPAWAPYVVLVPPLVAALAVARSQRRHPATGWVDGALRGLGGGVAGGILVGLVTALAGGSVGPGRMQVVAPYAFDVLVHAIAAFGVGGALGALAMTWWQRRAARHAAR